MKERTLMRFKTHLSRKGNTDRFRKIRPNYGKYGDRKGLAMGGNRK